MPSIRLIHLYRSSPRLVNALRVVWIAAILWFELGTFSYHVSQCNWPDTQVTSQQLVRLHILPCGVLLT